MASAALIALCSCAAQGGSAGGDAGDADGGGQRCAEIASGCACTPGVDQEIPCYEGQSDEPGVGACEKGTRTCSAAGAWSECVGQVLPADDACDGIDNDCDGETDEELIGCATCTGDGCLIRRPGPCVRRVDIGLDATVDQVWTHNFDSAPRLISLDYDSNADGTRDYLYTFDYANGLVNERIQYDANLTVMARLYYRRDESNRLIMLEHDINADGAIDHRHHYYYSSNLVSRVEIDTNLDGVADQLWFYTYDSHPFLVRQERQIGGVVDAVYTFINDQVGNTQYADLDNNGDTLPDQRISYDYSCWE